MILLIDGYNLLKNILTKSTVSEQERKNFLETIGRYAHKKHHKVIIVFDGGPYEWPHKERFMDMDVLYTGFKQSADTFIMHYIEEHQTKDILLVSSDHEINMHASEFEVPSIGSPEFGVILKDFLTTRASEGHVETPLIPYADSNHDLDMIMKEGSKHIPAKESDRGPKGNHARPSKHMSKLEKKLLLILRKL